MRTEAPQQLEPIGRIPRGWTVRAVKRHYSVTLGKMLQSSQQHPDETEEPYLRSANLSWSGVNIADIRTMWFSPAEKRRLALRSRDLLVSEGGDVGRACMWSGELPTCYIQNAVNRVRAIHSDSTRFLYYWLHLMKAAGYTDAIVNRITIGHLTAEKLEKFDFIRPLPDEQRRIAAYLDNACKAIDGAIDAKQKQLDTLADLRKSIIHKAVTRGLDDSVEMKPSSVDWLGEIPAHWDVSRVKRNCRLLRGKFSHRPRNDPALYNGDYPFIQTGDIAAAGKRIHSFSQTLNDQGLSVSRMFPRGTLVMAIAANIGDVAIMDFEACFPDSIVGFVPNHRVNLDYLYYLLGSMKQIFLRSAVLTTQLNINYVRIGTNFAPLPPESEQRAIAEHLDTSCRDLAALRKKLTEQIQTLHDYRKSLIHECVTGKRRITDGDILKVKGNI